jgi:DNA-binding transcriptional ArsR family regulator
MDDRNQLSDPRVLRAIAHPARTRILEEMSASGPVRAADVAQALGIPANQASFHLRQLAKYGLVEKAPEEARDKRDRVWRATSTQGYTVNLKQMKEMPGGAAAVDVFRANQLASFHAMVDRLFVLDRPEGSGVFSASSHSIRLTDEEADQLRGEIDDLLEAWTARTKGRDPGRRTYQVMQIIQPAADPGE